MKRLLVLGFLFLAPVLAKADIFGGNINGGGTTVSGGNSNASTATVINGPGLASSVSGSTISLSVNQGFPFNFTSGITAPNASLLTVSSSFTVNGSEVAQSSMIVNGNLFANRGVYFSTATGNGTGVGIVNANYTTGCQDNVILASATAPSGITITLGPAANCPNQVIQVTQVNQSTQPVTVRTTGADLIDAVTGQFILNAPGQYGELVSGGSSGWWEHGRGIEATPPYATAWESDGAAYAAVASSDTTICPFYVTVPVTITGFRYVVAATGGDLAQINFGVYDRAGNLLVSSGPITMGVSIGVQNKVMNPFNLSPGQYYFGEQHSATAMSTNGISAASTSHIFCSKNTATSMTLPNPFVFGTISSKGSATRMLTAGGRSTE